MRSYDMYPPYVPVAKRRAKAERKLKQLRKQNPNIKPVIIEGRTLATTWWGKSWNQNLERYADYHYRLERGRSYVRHRSVVDLQVKTGNITALVQGSSAQPYQIAITVDKLSDRNLVFTQFREITDVLHDFLATLFGRDGVILHGSVAVKQRKTLVDAFQAQDTYIPFMILSLKAGGVGLNLTEANHVVHFDRWWNPAVENQATDRAFRIGQQKSVVVHKFITQGTVEERIDDMIEEKARLSDDVVAAGHEQWITELEDDQLMELFSLRLN